MHGKRILIPLLSAAAIFAGSIQIYAQEAEQPTDLLAGAPWEYSIDNGKTFTSKPPVAESKKALPLIARGVFQIEDRPECAFLECTHGLSLRWQFKIILNGQVLKGPMEGMYYRTFPAINAGILEKGKNILEMRAAVFNRADKPLPLAPYMKCSLIPLLPEQLRIQTGPVLGAVEKDAFTLTCRTNMPAKVSLQLLGSGRSLESGPGFLHRFKVMHQGSGRDFHCCLLAEREGYSYSVSFKPPEFPDWGLRFVVMGDCRSNPKSWKKVADEAARIRPHLIVLNGDMVSHGLHEYQWDEEFFGPARNLFSAVPLYPVIGNHEANAPLYNEIFYTPTRDGKGRNWAQTIAGALIIGIDGLGNWSKGSENAKWLESTLAASKAAFIFLNTHYPAWTSGGHGKLAKDGRPAEKAIRWGQDVIVPLLEKYHATAMIAGHDHLYERSELPSGVTHIISGGAGAPLRGKSDTAQDQNPFSKAFASTLHFCLFTIDKETCRMEVLSPKGALIDTRTWTARRVE